MHQYLTITLQVETAMQIQDLAIPENLKQQYAGSGIMDLYPPQEACIAGGLLEGKNLLVAIPTASGKTLIAEMAMHCHIAAGGKCLYIVPLKALASEKFDEFSGKGVGVGISTGDLDRRDDALGRNDIIVATSEKVDSLLRNGARWIPEITLLVVDEVHLIDSPDRGPTLEMVIAKMRYRNPAMQIIGLSATIGNPKILAGWLDAEPASPVPGGRWTCARAFFSTTGSSFRKGHGRSDRYQRIMMISTSAWIRSLREASAWSLFRHGVTRKHLQSGLRQQSRARIRPLPHVPTDFRPVPRPR